MKCRIFRGLYFIYILHERLEIDPSVFINYSLHSIPYCSAYILMVQQYNTSVMIGVYGSRLLAYGANDEVGCLR